MVPKLEVAVEVGGKLAQITRMDAAMVWFVLGIAITCSVSTLKREAWCLILSPPHPRLPPPLLIQTHKVILVIVVPSGRIVSTITTLVAMTTTVIRTYGTPIVAALLERESLRENTATVTLLVVAKGLPVRDTPLGKPAKDNRKRARRNSKYLSILLLVTMQSFL